MAMRVKVSGIIGKIIEPYGKFNYGDMVKVIKLKFSKSDSSKNKVCIYDNNRCYWVNMNNVNLIITDKYSI